MVNGRCRRSTDEGMDCFRWQQCFLAGIHHMFLGFRDDYGVVQCLQPLSVKDIEIRAVGDRLASVIIDAIFPIRKHGAPAHLYRFSMSFVPLFDKQSSKIGQ